MAGAPAFGVVTVAEPPTDIDAEPFWPDAAVAVDAEVASAFGVLSDVDAVIDVGVEETPVWALLGFAAGCTII
ncbi:MAG: hypothetical protein K0U72_13575 [Gammaproteobacteria bacterium]|nr:hypothetical protein [Gammaproteobacteria bacterium]